MNHEEYKNKFGQKDVSNYELFDNYGNLIVKINTVNKEELQITKKGRYFLRVTDALIDKKFLNYLGTNGKFEGYIKAKTIYRGLDGYDHKVSIDIPKVRLSNYTYKSSFEEISQVNLLFELFIDDIKEYAIDYKVD